MKSNFLLEDRKLSKKTLFANKPLSMLFTDMGDEDDESSDSQWLAKSRRLQARRWRKIKHNLA